MNEVFLLFVTMEIILAVAVIGKVVMKFCDMKLEEIKLQRSMIERDIDEKHWSDELTVMQNRIDYSKSVMEYIRMVIAEQSIIEFRTFMDSHRLKKVTRSQVAHVVEDVARKVQENIQLENIQFDDTIMDEKFFIGYIVNLSVNNVKKLLNDAIEVYDEGDEQDE